MVLLVSILFAMIVGLAALCVGLYTRAVIARRQRETETKAMAMEREATASLIRLASEEMGNSGQDESFLDRYCDFVRRTMRVTGAAVFIREGDAFRGVTVCGIFPPLEDLPVQLREQLLSNPRHHKRHIQEVSLALGETTFMRLVKSYEPLQFMAPFPPWLPKTSVPGLGSLAVAPMAVRRELIGIVMVSQDTDNPPISATDASYLARLGEVAAICLDGIRISSERLEHDKRMRQAQESGMRQITSGVVHNIGNAITVAQLLASDMLRTAHQEDAQILDFVLGDMLPTMASHQESGDIGDFLRNDAQGSAYLTGLAELLERLARLHHQDRDKLYSLDQKLQHINDIIDLQQRFLGELGTEELVAIEEAARGAVTLFSETAAAQQVELVTHFGITERVLADRAMVTQVILNLLANALAAIGPDAAERRITLRTSMQRVDDTEFATCRISDTGMGVPAEVLPHLFEPGVQPPWHTADTPENETLDLHFCDQTIRKYNGRLCAESQPGKGTSVTVCLVPGGQTRA